MHLFVLGGQKVFEQATSHPLYWVYCGIVAMIDKISRCPGLCHSTGVPFLVPFINSVMKLDAISLIFNLCESFRFRQVGGS